jgi:multisubunit Na+/H+ antiporter MnhE subunit
MELPLLIFGTAFAAVVVWLGVRIVNRRQRWAKWTLAALLGLPVLYALSFGPWCWISSRLQPSGKLDAAIYSPIIRAGYRGPLAMRESIRWWASFGMSKDARIILTYESTLERIQWILAK